MLNLNVYFLPEVLSFSALVVCFGAILLTTKFFGKSGLYSYLVISSITSNIQVLKLTQYSMISDPVALGTVLFSTTFAVDNILTEYYGAKAARKGLYISFFGYLFFVIIMQIAILHPPVIQTDCVNLHREIKAIFSQSVFLFVSSLAAYFAGQSTDIFVYSNLKKVFKGKYLIARSMFSMSVSAFVDNCVFSFLAWIVFADNPISLADLWKTYIVITYLMRLVIAALCLPLVRLAGNFIPEAN